MKRFFCLAVVAALLIHTDARAMLRDASIDHDLDRIKKSFELLQTGLLLTTNSHLSLQLR